MTEERFIRADKSYRRRVILLYGVLACLGGLVILGGLPWAEQYLRKQDLPTALRIVRRTLFFVFLSVALLGLYVLRFGRSLVLKHGRFPPPNHKVIRDTTLLEGQEAKTRGRILVFLALMLVSLGLAGALYVPRVLEELGR